MTYPDIISLLVSAFGAGLAFGMLFGVVARFMRSLGHN